MKTKNLIIAFAMLAIASCKKDETPEPVLGAKDLIAKKWKQVSAIETYSYQPGSTDVFSSYDECDKDDITIFNTNGTYNYSAGALKCSANSPDVLESGTWTLTSNDTKISITSGGTTYALTIAELTATSLKLKDIESIPLGSITTSSTFVLVP
jgi:Lipocalin-like domain